RRRLPRTSCSCPALRAGARPRSSSCSSVACAPSQRTGRPRPPRPSEAAGPRIPLAGADLVLSFERDGQEGDLETLGARLHERAVGVGAAGSLAHGADADDAHIGDAAVELLVTRATDDQVTGFVAQLGDELFFAHVAAERLGRV